MTETDTTPRTWKITLGDKTVSFDDLPTELFQKVANSTGESWVSLYHLPIRNSYAYAELVGAIAAHLEVEPPPAPKTMGDLRKMTALLEQVPVDLPVEYEDGFPPVADDQTTVSSSGSSAVSDGLPTS